MASSKSFICLFALIAACCLAGEARRLGKIRKARHVVLEPQKQTMFDFPFEQTQTNSTTGGSATGGSAAGGSAAGGSAGGAGTGSFMSDYGTDSESSEESDLDMEMDMDVMDTFDANEVDAGDATFMFGGNGRQVSGNLRPFLSDMEKQEALEAGNQDRLLSRTSGSSNRGVGIAFAVLGLLAVVVAAIAFVIGKYRHSIPIFRCY